MCLPSLRLAFDSAVTGKDGNMSQFAEAARLHRLGVLEARSARYHQAIELIGKALELAPGSPVAHSNLGISLRAMGRLDEAVACYDRALQLKPDYAEAHDNLGNVLMDLGRLEQAVACYSRAVEIKPEYAEGHYNRGNALLRLGQVEEAIRAYRAALRLKPELVEAYNNLGVALAELGRDESAIELYDRAADLQQPGFENPLANKALLLMETGRTAQSLDAIDQALTVNTGSAAAWHIRAGLKKFSGADPDIPAMETLLAGLRASGEAQPSKANLADQISLEFALGKAKLDSGAAEEAFTHLHRGNRLERSTFSYDSAATQRWIAGMAESFTPERMRHASGAGYPSEAPVFIVGMPRSGTTLVEQILASHPDIYGAGELMLLEDIVARVSGRKDAMLPSGDPRWLSRLSRDKLYRSGSEYAAQACILSSGWRRVVDKMPTNFLYAGFIHAILPNARIIHCRRDPVDTCFSCYTKLFSEVRFSFDLRELGLYYRCYESLLAHWRELLPPQSFIEVQYEDVVEDVAGQTRRLIEFCGLPWDPACLAFHENRRPVRTASVTQVRQPIYRSSVGRWKPYARYLGPLLEALDVKVFSHDVP
jgi:tetratricopeptide (TPR) repeat protein